MQRMVKKIDDLRYFACVLMGAIFRNLGNCQWATLPAESPVGRGSPGCIVQPNKYGCEW